MKKLKIFCTNNMVLHRKTLYNMKLTVGIFALILIATTGFTQDEEALNKIESARIALITERLGLSPEQAEKFWPLYREYTQHRQELLKEYQSMRKSSDGKQISDEESKALLQKGIKLKERQLDLDRNYNDKLNRVITNNQILLLRRAEEDFRKMILQRLDNRREQRERLNKREERKSNDQ
jgi:hypothetical protein